MLPLTSILVASEAMAAMAASKQPRRSYLALELNSVTLITYDAIAMLIWPLIASIHKRFVGE